VKNRNIEYQSRRPNIGALEKERKQRVIKFFDASLANEQKDFHLDASS
jgi:hypothetical protein